MPAQEITARLAEVLAQPASELWQHALRALALQALSCTVASADSAVAVLQQAELVPRLLQWACAPGATRRAELLTQRLELQQLLQSEVTAGSTATSRTVTAETLPYRVGEPLPAHTPLPTHFEPSRSPGVLFLDTDMRRVRFFGKDGEDITLTANAAIPDAAAQFYFEVHLENLADTKGQVHVGLCPAQSVPGYGPSLWALSQAGVKMQPLALPADQGTKLFVCPYCQQEELTGRELCTHARQRHTGMFLCVVFVYLCAYAWLILVSAVCVACACMHVSV